MAIVSDPRPWTAANVKTNSAAVATGKLQTEYRDSEIGPTWSGGLIALNKSQAGGVSGVQK